MRMQFNFEKVWQNFFAHNFVKKQLLNYIFLLLWASVLIAGCGSTPATTFAVATNQPSLTLTRNAISTPTSAVTATLISIPTLTQIPALTQEVAQETETEESVTTSNETVVFLPTPTPTTSAFSVTPDTSQLVTSTPELSTEETLQPLALSEIAEAVPTIDVNPAATIAAQLEEQIESDPASATVDTPPVQNVNDAPPMPTTLSPLPVVNAVPAPLQIPSELGWDGVQRSVRVPILMYHYISTPPANADIYRKDLSVSPELFNAQLDRIQAEGYTTISLYDLSNHLMKGTSLPEKAIVITFDDGYRDNFENAFPALKARGMRATFFVVMEFANAQRPEYMTWDMLREMHNAGMSIEAHGVDHRSLKKRDRDFLAFQALRSYETLQNELGQRARFISYPAGQYDQNTIEVFKSAGYWAGITTIQGATHATDALFELRRVRVRGNTSPDELVALLAIDW